MSEYFAHINANSEKQTVEDHLLKVAELARCFSDKIGLSKAGKLIGLLHDLGKYSDSFQTYIGSASGLIDQDADEYVDAQGMKGKIDHSTAGAQYLWNALEIDTQQKQIAAQILALCLVSHHSGLIDCITPDGEDNFNKRMNKKTEYTHLDEVLAKIEPWIKTEIIQLLKDDVYNDIIDLMQKIALKEKSEKSIRTLFQFGLMTRMLFSCLIDADRLDTADFENPKKAKERQCGTYKNWEILINRLEKHLNEYDNNPVRTKIDEIRKSISESCLNRSTSPIGVFTLTVPTGGGKTLSSLRFAMNHAKKHALDRIIYIIPFTSIIEQNAKVVREILEINEEDKGKIILEHHSNLLPELQNWKSKILNENWDAPIIFTTNVQFLEILFGAGTRSARRMHQLARSIIIFDEIQAIPLRTIHLFCNAINYLTNHCYTSVVLCTATQPLLNKVPDEMGRISFTKENEIIPDVNTLFCDLKRVKIKNYTKPLGWSAEEIAVLANTEMNESGSCLIVVNTKKNARIMYEECLKNHESSVYHLSTSMCAAHRMEKLAEIKEKLRKDEPLICVSTQLIEAGVDIDFGSVIRFVAGLDSVAQAAGRCNRAGKRSMGNVYIINPREETIDSLIDIKIGKEKTERILREFQTADKESPIDLIHPDIMELYFKYYFYDRADEMVFKITNERENTLLNMLSVNGFAINEMIRKYNKSPEIYLKQSFMTAYKAFKAIDAPTRGIIVPYGEGNSLIAELYSQFAMEKQYDLLIKAQRYSVNVFPNVLKILFDEKAVKEVPEIGVLTLSDKRYYHPEFGLCTEISTEYECLTV